MIRICGGRHKGRQLRTPKGDLTRPTTEANRESLFNIVDISLQHPMTHILDLFSGSGALALEAVSRGAESAVLFDSSKEAESASKQNFREIAPEIPLRIFTDPKIEKWAGLLVNLGPEFRPIDTVFCDPPYGKGFAQKVLESLLPQGDLWAPGAIFCFEVGKKEVFPIPKSLEILRDRTRGDSRFLVLRKSTFDLNEI